MIKEDVSVVTSWLARMRAFRKDKELIGRRIYPYTRVPDFLTGESRNAILELADILHLYLEQKKQLRSTKRVAEQFLNGELTADNLDIEWKKLSKKAALTLAQIK
nr:hypothetical protein [uncultured Rhodopila sp.]